MKLETVDRESRERRGKNRRRQLKPWSNSPLTTRMPTEQHIEGIAQSKGCVVRLRDIIQHYYSV